MFILYAFNTRQFFFKNKPKFVQFKINKLINDKLRIPKWSFAVEHFLNIVVIKIHT